MSTDNKIEFRLLAIGSGLDIQHKGWIEDAVGFVLGYAGKEQLSGQDGSARDLHLDVDMLGPAGIESGNNGGQLVVTGGIGELVTAEV